MGLKRNIMIAFAAVSNLAACGLMPGAAARREARIDELQHRDSVLVAKAGFNIVARSGMGDCDDQGNLRGSPGYYGHYTDMTYVLSDSNGKYVACIVHGGSTDAIKGLKSVNAPVVRR